MFYVNPDRFSQVLFCTKLHMNQFSDSGQNCRYYYKEHIMLVKNYVIRVLFLFFYNQVINIFRESNHEFEVKEWGFLS